MNKTMETNTENLVEKTIESSTEEGAKKISLQKEEKPQKPSFFRVLICIFISLVLATGGIFGISSTIRSARALVKCGSVSLDQGSINYLASYYKSIYIRSLRITGVSAQDTEEFWQSECTEGGSWGEHFDRSFKEYLASLVAAANIYLTYSKYTPEDKIAVAKTTDEILKLRAEGSVALFNEMTEPYGFDYDDFQNAAAILYKANRAPEVIYGEGGVNLLNYPELCEEYLQKYTHVSLLFVKINDEMPDSEREEKQKIIDDLMSAVQGQYTEKGRENAEKIFEKYLKESDGDPEMHSRGYYFRYGAEKTAEFESEFSEVVEASMLMKVGSYKAVTCSVGYCFIYRSEPTPGAYTDKGNIFFSDFLSDAAVYHYEKILEPLSKDVSFTERYNKLAPLSVPVLQNLYIKEFKKPATH